MAQADLNIGRLSHVSTSRWEREKKRAGEHQSSRTGHVSFLCFSFFNEGKLIASSPSAKGTQAHLFSLSKRAG